MRPQIFLKSESLFKVAQPLVKDRCSFQYKQSSLSYFPWSASIHQNISPIPSSLKGKPFTTSRLRFFSAFEKLEKKESIASTYYNILCNKNTLKRLLQDINPSTEENYLQTHFVHWLSAYANDSQSLLQDYFSDRYSLDPVCKDFINFCFKNGIFLDEHKTLQSFSDHNQLSGARFFKTRASKNST